MDFFDILVRYETYLWNHLDDRLQALLDGAEEIAEFLSSLPRGEDWDQDAALVLAQVTDSSDVVNLG